MAARLKGRLAGVAAIAVRVARAIRGVWAKPLPAVLARRVPRALAAALGSVLTAFLVWALLVRLVPYPMERLAVHAAASLTVLDRNGERVWQSGSATGERRDWVPLEQIAPVLVQASLAAEDHRFFEHSGVDAWGVLRAAWLNLSSGRQRYGGSTISMQLVRLVEPQQSTRTLWGKFNQALSAARLDRALGKQEILEQYLNRAYYGNGAFGAEAAARLYFSCSAAMLSPGQAAFLAALPRAPRAYDPYKFRPRAEQRQRHILDRMHELGWLSDTARQVALDAPLVVGRARSGVHARHFIDHLLTTLPDDVVQGKRLTTTLDLRLQEQLEVATRRHLESIGSRAVTQAGVIVLDNRTGDILAMLGSGDYSDASLQGAVNVTTVRRRPGSTLKPFVYALALERGDSPATLAYDVVLPGEANQTYTADVKQHGFARYRESLAGSYNLAAVHTLEKVGVLTLLERLRLAGVTTLDKADSAYSLDLAIGDAEVELIEYTGAFANFGNQGRAVRPRAVLRVEDNESLPFSGDGKSMSGSAAQARRWAEFGAPVTQVGVFSDAVAYQIFDILADPDARRPMFGRSAPMELPFPVALKTGTTRGYTDNLALGTTREFTVGAWAGNFDGTSMQGVMAMQGAAPLVRAAFVALAAIYGDPTAPERPKELQEREVCPLSGERLGQHCPGRKRELFTNQSAQRFDAGPVCTFHTDHAGQSAVTFPDELAHWARAHGLRDVGRTDGSRDSSTLSIVYPRSGSRYALDPGRPARLQIPPLRALPRTEAVEFTIDGVLAHQFQPTPGRHVVQARLGSMRDEVEIFFE